MRSTDPLPVPPARSHAYDQEVEELRIAFQGRLRDERVGLVALSASLAGVEGGAVPIFNELRDCAHKIQGGAAVFELTEVASAARALEVAALAAAQNNADNTNSAVWTALVALVRLLGTLPANHIN